MGARRKRFFDVIALDALFDTGWQCLSARNDHPPLSPTQGRVEVVLLKAGRTASHG